MREIIVCLCVVSISTSCLAQVVWADELSELKAQMRAIQAQIEEMQRKTESAISEESPDTKTLCALGDKVENFPFYVYKDGGDPENNFFNTGTMGDFRPLDTDLHYTEAPHKGVSCIKVIYDKNPAAGYGWAGQYWQYPHNNWGNIPKAYDLSGATKLTFWARGEYGGEEINKFQVGGLAGEYRDSGVASIGPIILSKEWKKYTIDLTKMDNSIITNHEDKECWPFMEPLTRIIGGFCWATSIAANHDNSVIFYLDEIRFER